MSTLQLAVNLTPQHLIETFGLIGIAAIVFAESGLLVGFFLPGDSLLFTAGAAAAGVLSRLHVSFHIWTLMPLVVIAAIAGDQVGYLIGSVAGASLSSRPDSLFFRRRHLDRAIDFFERHGPRAIVLARFVPVVRTFCPVVAGIGTMPHGVFLRYNIVGGMLWGISITLLGYFFGQIGIVRNNLEVAILGIVALSLLPVVIEVIRHRRRR